MASRNIYYVLLEPITRSDGTEIFDVYHILNAYFVVEIGNLFRLAVDGSQGHASKLYKPMSDKLRDALRLSVSPVNERNRLPSGFVMVLPAVDLKRHLDRHWLIDFACMCA